MRRYAIAFGSVALAVLLRWVLDPLLGNHLSFATFLLAVLVTAWAGGRGPGLAALVAGALAADLWFIPPRGGFGFSQPEQLVALATYVIAGFFAVWVSESQRRARLRAEENARRARDRQIQLEQERAERERAEREVAQLHRDLSRRVHELQTLFDAAPVGIAVAQDPECRIIYTNRAAAAMLGLGPDANASKSAPGGDALPFRVLQNGREIPPEELPMQRAAAKDLHVRDVEVDLARDDGEVLRLFEYASPLHDEDGRVRGCLGIFVDITARQRAEESLRESEARFRMLADSAPVLIWMSGTRKEGLYFNKRWLEFRGKTMEEECGERWLEGIHPDDLDALQDCARAFEKREPFQTQFRLRGADGEYRWMLDTGVPRFTEDGFFVGYIGSCLDISQLKETEAERQRLLEQLTLLVEASSTLISGLDLGPPLARILRLASRVVAADGYAVWRFLPEEGRWRIVASQGISERYQEEAARALAGRGHLRLERPLIVEDADREELLAAHREVQRAEGIVSLLVMPLRILGDCTGTLAFYYRQPHRFPEAEVRVATAIANLAAAAIDGSLLHEATERARVRAERAADRVARLQRVTEAFSDACTTREVCDVVVDEGMEALRAQMGAAALVSADGSSLDVVRASGYPGDMVERWRSFPLSAPVPPADAVRSGIPVFLETPEERLARYPYLATVPGLGTRASACIPLLVQGKAVGVIAFGFDRASAFSEEDRSFLVALGRQCAQALERARLYDVEQAARTAAEEANRAKDAFLAMLAHELRNPLVPLWNGLRLLRPPADRSSGSEVALASMERQLKHLARLVDDLLDVSRLTRGKILLRTESCDLAALVTQATGDFRKLFDSAGIDLSVHLPHDPVWVLADPTRLSQVLGNLLSNALKFTDAGGQVRVALAPEPAKNGDPARAVLTVSDTGIGMEPAMIAQLFEPFSQADSSLERSRGGLGLGLSLVNGLVELHGGTVQCESRGPGHGSRFTVHLPVHESPAAEPAAERPEAPAAENGSRRVLIIEDNVDAAQTLSLLLSMSGHTVAVAHSGPEGVRAAREHAPEVVFCDVGLPGGMTGYDVARALRADATCAPAYLVALTGYGQTEDQEEALRAGFDLHLTKPVDPNLLEEIVARAPSAPADPKRRS